MRSWSFFIFAFLAFSGPIPRHVLAEDPIHLGVSDKRIDAFFDLDFGVHQIPKTNVIFSQNPKIADQTRLEKVLGLDVNGVTRQVLQDSFGGKDPDPRFTISAKAEGDGLVISPWIFLNVLEDGRVLLWTIWNVEYWDLYWNKMKWKGCCFACMSGPRPLTGKGGWDSDDGKIFEAAIRKDAQKLIELTRKDLTGGYRQLNHRSERILAPWLGQKKAKEIGVDLREIDPKTFMVNYFGEKEATEFEAGGLVGVLLKDLNKSSLLFSGSSIVPNDFGEIVPKKQKITPSPSPQNK